MEGIRQRLTANFQWLMARVDSILLYSTFGLLMFGPLAFGAVEPWSIFILEIGCIILTMLWLLKQWLGSELTIQWSPLYPPMAGFGVLVLLQISLRASAYHHDTISGALLYSAYAMLCFLSGQTLLRSSQARKIAVLLGLYGFLVSAFALVYSLSSNGKLYWFYPLRHGGAVYGPYVNHNHYAGLMEMLVPIPLVLALTRLAGERERIAAGIAAAIMVGTIFLSGSRGGMIAIFVELVVMSVILLRQKVSLFRHNKGLQVTVIATFAVVLVGLLWWVGGKDLTSRVSSIATETHTELSGGMRLSIDRDALRMFRQKPVLGWGLGTFPIVYPQFRSFYTTFFVNEAHNDYLQLLSEMGLLGLGTMIWFMVVLYRHAIRKMDNWTSDVSGAVTLACTLGITGIMVHSLLDFNLQVPANAALYYVLCTIAAAPPLWQRSRKRRPVTSEEEVMLPASEVV